jgi:hypothetical protein
LRSADDGPGASVTSSVRGQGGESRLGGRLGSAAELRQLGHSRNGRAARRDVSLNRRKDCMRGQLNAAGLIVLHAIRPVPFSALCPVFCPRLFVAPVQRRASAFGRPSPVQSPVILPHGGSGGNHFCRSCGTGISGGRVDRWDDLVSAEKTHVSFGSDSETGRRLHRKDAKSAKAWFFAIFASWRCCRQELIRPFAACDCRARSGFPKTDQWSCRFCHSGNAIAGRAGRSRVASRTGRSTNGILFRKRGRRGQPHAACMANEPCDGECDSGQIRLKRATTGIERCGQRGSRGPGVCGRTFGVTERRQDRPTIPLDPSAA